MKRLVNYTFIILTLLSLATACRDPFDPDLPANQANLLVVEGYINTGGGITTIKLSRTTQLDEIQREVLETGAQLSIEQQNGESFNLSEVEAGKYASDFLNLDKEGTYRLKIRTSNGKEYTSDFVESIVTPEIDEVKWERNKGIDIYVSTHDPNNKTWYYQWEFEEIWEIQSPVYSTIKYEDGIIKPRPTAESDLMFVCWRIEKSKDLLLGSSTKLTRDIINDYYLQSIAQHSERVGFKYSMLVKQNALSKEAFNYLQLVKKNTDQVGSLFDPQASELSGNIHAINDPAETVIGFVGAYTTTEKRIIINNSQLKGWTFDYSLGCGGSADTIANKPEDLAGGLTVRIPTSPIYNQENTPATIDSIIAYMPSCVDCRRRGGNKVPRPSFW